MDHFHKTPHRGIDINITYRCNLSCCNCDRLCYIHDFSLPDITLDRVQRISDTIPVDRPEICIAGGEPTLHPLLPEIVQILKREGRHIAVFTNGAAGAAVWANNYSPIQDCEVRVMNQHSKEKIGFIAQQAAPIDFYGDTLDWSAPGCWISDYCGYGVDFEGAYPCACGAMINRIFHCNVAVADVSDCTPEVVKRQKNALCRYCGYYTEYVLKQDHVNAWGKQVTSKSWKEALSSWMKY